MTFRGVLCAVGMTTLLICRSGGLKAQRSPIPTFHADAQMVLIPVTVTDHQGKTIEGLQAADFSVLDDHKLQHIVSFASEDSPCSVGIVLDSSGSMRNLLAAAKDIADAFLENSNSQDEFQLSTISTWPKVRTGFTNDKVLLESEIAAAKPEGMTALVDTLYFAMSRMREARQPQRALFVLSDGGENYSRYSQTELMREALEADVRVYSLLFNTGSPGGGATAAAMYRPNMVAKPGQRSDGQQNIEALEKLSEKTGGIYFHVKTAAEAKNAAARVAIAVRNHYLIGYRPSYPNELGKWHRVQVRVNAQRVNVHARNGYYSR